MGRKNAKTVFSACLLLLHLCGPEYKFNSQLFSSAQSQDQAAILFRYAAKIVRLSEELNGAIVVRDTAKQLACPELGTLYRALSAEYSTAYGLSPAFVVHDELGQVRGSRSEMYEALETAAGAMEDPLSVVISTQAPHDGDWLSILIDDALSGKDERIKVVLYTAAKEADPFSVAAIRAANPHFDDFMNKEEVLKLAADAKRMPSREAFYRNLILNQRVESENPFVSAEVWKRNAGNGEEIEEGSEIVGGLDLSAVADLTSCEWVKPPPKPEERWAVKSDFWLPSEGLAQKSARDRVPYDLWAQKGLITATPGASIEYEFIAEYLRDMFKRYRVKAVAFDRYNMKFLKPWLIKVGMTDEEIGRFVEFGQGFVSMSPALRVMESMLLEGRLAHGNNPVLQMCAANARVVKDPAENRKFTKAKATGRIDGMVALAMALGTAVNIGVGKEYKLIFV